VRPLCARVFCHVDGSSLCSGQEDLFNRDTGSTSGVEHIHIQQAALRGTLATTVLRGLLPLRVSGCSFVGSRLPGYDRTTLLSAWVWLTHTPRGLLLPCGRPTLLVQGRGPHLASHPCTRESTKTPGLHPHPVLSASSRSLLHTRNLVDMPFRSSHIASHRDCSSLMPIQGRSPDRIQPSRVVLWVCPSPHPSVVLPAPEHSRTATLPTVALRPHRHRLCTILALLSPVAHTRTGLRRCRGTWLLRTRFWDRDTVVAGCARTPGLGFRLRCVQPVSIAW